MAEPLRPTAAKSYLRENWYFVPVIASATLAPTVAEIGATSALDITNIVFRDATFAPEQNTNLVEQNPRLGDEAQYQFVGSTTYSGGQVTMQFNPQGAASSDEVSAWETLGTGGVSGYMVRRLNIPKATAAAAGQFVDVYPAELGPFMPTTSGEGEGAETAMAGSWAITSKPAFKVAVLA